MADRVVLCPTCGTEMQLQVEDLTLGLDGGGGALSSWFYKQFEVDLYACPQCKKVELYCSVPFVSPPEPPSQDAESADAQEDTQPDSTRPSTPKAPWKMDLFRRKKDKPDWEL